MPTESLQTDVPSSRAFRNSANGTWLGSPLTRHRRRLQDLASLIPTFHRRPFELAGGQNGGTAANANYEAIVRLPMSDGECEIPVGIVSHGYQLLQHRTVIERVLAAFSKARIDVDGLDATLSITPYGERMALSIVLPDEKRFSYALGEN